MTNDPPQDAAANAAEPAASPPAADPPVCTSHAFSLPAFLGQPSEALPRRVEVACQVAGLFRASNVMQRRERAEFDPDQPPELSGQEERCYIAALDVLTRFLRNE